MKGIKIKNGTVEWECPTCGLKQTVEIEKETNTVICKNPECGDTNTDYGEICYLTVWPSYAW